VNGALNLLIALALLFAPLWFFENIGNFAPFNRHYEGDLGASILPMGIGLFVAARNPSAQRTLIGLVALGNIVHVFNHVYDAVLMQAPLTHWLLDTAPLAIAALLLLWAWRHSQ
jgi:predicted anti-sigma-YlaC factor YlaD